MKRRTLSQMIAALPVLPTLSSRAATRIHVYKNASCDCCTGWSSTCPAPASQSR